MASSYSMQVWKVLNVVVLMGLSYGGSSDATSIASSSSSSPSSSSSSSAGGATSLAASSAASTLASSSVSESSNNNGGGPAFPAFFVFGDSLVDVGNNNYITTVARANNLPFGIDFPQGPTGRFTNGKVVPDVICELLGLPFPPPYLAPTTKGQVLLKGVSYASAAAGILRSTGYNFVGRVDFDTQITWFANNVQQIEQLIGSSATQELLASSLISVTMGANDYVNNYLLRTSPLPLQYNTQQFQQLLIDKLATQLTGLYNLGARKVSVTNIGPIGCIPSQLAKAKSVNGECAESVNNLALGFNQALSLLVPQLNAQLPGARFVIVDGFTPIFNYRTNPSAYGFKVGDTACCGGGSYNGQLLCLPIIKPCPNREDYVFWDAFHPTEGPNRLLGATYYSQLMALA